VLETILRKNAFAPAAERESEVTFRAGVADPRGVGVVVWPLHHPMEAAVAQLQILDGMDIYDWDGTKIGKVTRYEKKLGYLETSGTFTGPRYIPFSAVERIGPAGAYLNVSADRVSALYKRMPPVTPSVDASGRLTGGGTVASGYTGRPIPLDAEGIQMVREKIGKGSKVLDADGKKVGTVDAYDTQSGYMRVAKGELFPKDLFLPVTAVWYLDDKGIHLSEPKDAILNHFVRVPEVAQEFFAH